jgi:hypothetical protein
MKKIKKRCVGLALAGAAFVFFDLMHLLIYMSRIIEL